MTQAAYPIDGLRRDILLFPFDARGKRNDKATISADTRRLQQIQKELRQLSLPELQKICKLWREPPLATLQWVRELLPYLDGLIKERTPKKVVVERFIKQPPMPPSISATAVDVTSLLVMEVRDLRAAVEVLNVRIAAGLPPSVERTSKPLPPPRQHAKGKKRRLLGPVGELAAIARYWLESGVARVGQEIEIYPIQFNKTGITPKRLQSSLSAMASNVYGRRSMHTRLVRNSSGVETGIAFTFVGNPNLKRMSRRSSTVVPTIDQSTPT